MRWRRGRERDRQLERKVDEAKRFAKRSLHRPAVVESIDVDARTMVVSLVADRTVTLELTAVQGILPPVGSQIMLAANGADPLALAPTGTLVEGGWFSKNFPGFGLGGPGWGIDADANCEFNNARFRGLVSATGGANLLPNGIFDADITGWTTLGSLYTPSTGSYVTTPDSAPLSITSDIEIRVCVVLNDWTPASSYDILAKAGSYSFWYDQSVGRLKFFWSTNGVDSNNLSSTAAPPGTDWFHLWLRVTFDANNGAAGRTATFYYSNDPIDTDPDDVTWTPLGTPATSATATSINNSANALTIGGNGAVSTLIGQTFYAEVRDGIGGTKVANPDWRDASVGPTVTDDFGNTFTAQGAAAKGATPSLETDTGLTFDSSAGAYKLATVGGLVVRHVDSDPLDIDPRHPLFGLEALIDASNSLNRAKGAIRFLDDDDALISEVEGDWHALNASGGYEFVAMQSGPPTIEVDFTDFAPNEDTLFSGAAAAGVPIDTSGDRYENVDEAALDATDYVEVVPPAAPDNVHHLWRAAVGTGNLAGKRITGVEILVDAARAVGSGHSVLSAGLNVGGTTYGHPGGDRVLSGSNVRYGFLWELNPDTDAPWTISAVEEFDDTDEVLVSATAGVGAQVRLYRYSLRVHWEDDAPVPTRARARLYLDQGHVSTNTWHVENFVLRQASSVTAPFMRTAETKRRVEIDSVARPEIRLRDDDDGDLATIGRRTGVQLRRTSDQGINNLVTYAVSWETAIQEEPDGWWSSGTTVTIARTGLIAVTFSAQMTASGSYDPFVDVTRAGIGSTRWEVGVLATTFPFLTATEWLEEGDTLVFNILNASGAARTLTNAWLQLHRIVSG